MLLLFNCSEPNKPRDTSILLEGLTQLIGVLEVLCYYVCVCVSACVSVRVCMFLSGCMCVYMFTRVCLSLWPNVWLIVWLFLRKYIGIHTCVLIYLWIYLHLLQSSRSMTTLPLCLNNILSPILIVPLTLPSFTHPTLLSSHACLLLQLCYLLSYSNFLSLLSPPFTLPANTCKRSIRSASLWSAPLPQRPFKQIFDRRITPATAGCEQCS